MELDSQEDEETSRQNSGCPVLVTERLVLRAPHVEDTDAIACLANNARVATRLPFRVWLHVYGASLSGILLGYDLCFIASILLPVQRDLQLCPTCNQASDKSLAHCACALKQFRLQQI